MTGPGCSRWSPLGSVDNSVPCQVACNLDRKIGGVTGRKLCWSAFPLVCQNSEYLRVKGGKEYKITLAHSLRGFSLCSIGSKAETIVEWHGGAKLFTSWLPGSKAQAKSASERCTLQRNVSSNYLLLQDQHPNSMFGYELIKGCREIWWAEHANDSVTFRKPHLWTPEALGKTSRSKHHRFSVMWITWWTSWSL